MKTKTNNLTLSGKLIILIGFFNFLISGFWIISRYIIKQRFGHDPLYLIDSDPTSSNLLELTLPLGLTFLIEIPLLFTFIFLIINKKNRMKKLNILEYIGIMGFIFGLGTLIYFRFLDRSFFSWVMD